LAEKCIGVREDTGGQCNRSASSGSDFCYKHQSQEGDTTILHQGADVYHCPQDGTKLHYAPKEGYHRCKSCKGVLLSAKAIDPKYAEKISQLNEIGAHQEVCPSCAEGANLSIHEVEWKYETKGAGPFGNKLGIGSRTEYEIANVWLCNNCGSLWVPRLDVPGQRSSYRDGLLFLFGYLHPEHWMGADRNTGRWNFWVGHSTWLDNQVEMREKRLEAEAINEQRLEILRTKWCNHMDDQGEQCRKNKSQKSSHDQDYCYKHQPK
jgi:hypothetical protein